MRRLVIFSRLLFVGIALSSSPAGALSETTNRRETLLSTFSLLSAFDSSSSHTKWDPLDGSVALFVKMDLIMECVVVVIYIGVGFIIPRIRYNKRERGAVSAGNFGKTTGHAEGQEQRK